MSRFFLTLHQSRPRKQGHVQFWPLADISAVAIDVRFQGKSGHNFHQLARQLMTDAVEKGKNEPIEIFAFAPVETGFSQSEGSQ
ncbi:MAG: hypothetical protein WBW35_02810 [Xanthobacteraceae bacterium]